ncbi:hypothetical protein ACFL0S_03215 [Thermodesulfobacteriota bacterium]
MSFVEFIRSDRAGRFLVPTFFLLFWILGVSIFDHYGVSWDERRQHKIAQLVVSYIFDGNDSLLQDPHPKYHGPVVPLILGVVRMSLDIVDRQQGILLWHLANFHFFYFGVVFFYLLCLRKFNDWKIGILGCLFLILSPRIFAHSFYNHKDIPFLAFFIISIFTLLKLTDKPTVYRIVIHALVCGILIDIRIMGILVPLITVFLLAIDPIFEPEKEKRKGLVLFVKKVLIFLFLLSLFTVLFWPSLWKDPFNEFISAIVFSKQIDWSGDVFYLGKIWSAGTLPWHYLPVWIIISTPILYLFLFTIGATVLSKTIIKNPKASMRDPKIDLVALLWFFLPLLSIISFKSIVYDDWRHLYFIYPALIFIALIGYKSIESFLGSKDRRVKITGRLVVSSFVIFSILKTMFVMIDSHPFQNVYFNILSGNPKQQRFELDYWGLSYRNALEYILENDTSQVIKVSVPNTPGIDNYFLLPRNDRKRLRYVKQGEADYYLTNYRGKYENKGERGELWYSIEVGGRKIMGVYRYLN